MLLCQFQMFYYNQVQITYKNFMTQKLILLVSIFIALTSQDIQRPDEYFILSQIKTEKKVGETTINPKNIYAIDMQRIGTNKQSQISKCNAQQKQIKVLKQFQKFRVNSSNKNQKSVYQSITQLQDREDGIDTFKILGDKIMVIMLNGSAFFLSNNKETQTNLKPINLQLQVNFGKFRLIPHIAPINGNAYIATPRQVSFCQPGLYKCMKIQGFKGVDVIADFFAYEFKNKHYLFFLTGNTLTTYQVSTNGMLFTERIYDAKFFKKQKVYLQQIMPLPGNKLLILDFYSGLIEVQHSAASIANLTNSSRVVYQQYGCRDFSYGKQGDYISLHCSLTQKTYFVLQLNRIQGKLESYAPHQPIFFNQVVVGIDTNTEIIMAKIFTGVRLFWASTQIQSPYPYDYQRAGSIFLHNAKASELWTLNDRKVIYICTEDQLRIYELTVSNPQINCFSLVQIRQQYKLVYTHQCEKDSPLHPKICTTEKKLNYQSYEIRQLSYKTTLLPLIVSAILVIAVGILLYKLSSRYDKQKQKARERYNIRSEQFVEQIN